MPPAFHWLPEIYFLRGARLNFTMQHQQQSNWCWAATATSVSHFYWGLSPWTQCDLVNAEFNQSTCCDDGSTSQCNKPWYLNLALTRTHNYVSMTSGMLSRSQILAELEGGRPIAIRIGWGGGGGHAVAIYGFNPLIDKLSIGDPWYGNSIVDYDTFLTAYQGSGSWTHTYFTKSYIRFFFKEPVLMPIFTKIPPPEVTHIIEHDLSALLHPSPPPPTPEFRDANIPENLNVHSTHPVYTATLSQAVQRSIFDDAHITAWRALVSDSDTPLASIDVQTQADTYKISHINEGPFVQATLETLQKVSDLKSTQNGDYELRVLEIPALYIRAVWLKNATERNADIVIPMAPAPTALEPGREYSAREFEEITTTLSRQHLDRDNDETGRIAI